MLRHPTSELEEMEVDDAPGAMDGNTEYLRRSNPYGQNNPRVAGYKRQELCPHKYEDNRMSIQAHTGKDDHVSSSLKGRVCKDRTEWSAPGQIYI